MSFPIAVDSSVFNRYFDKKVRCIGGLRQGREGLVINVEIFPGGGGIHVKVRFPNGAEHWHHVDTVERVG